MEQNPDVFFGKPEGPFVLLLEDRPDLARQMADALRASGHDTQAVAAISDLAPAVRSRRPIAIAWDESVPARLGAGSLRAALTDPILHGIPCICMTRSEEASPTGARETEAVQKPLDIHALLERIRASQISPIGGRLRVLTIDDEEGVRGILSKFLERAGYRVETAAGGEEGIQKALANPPDLILLDVRMPGMDGIEVAERLRLLGPTMDIPIMMFTGSDLSDEERARISRKVVGITKKGEASFEKFLSHLRRIQDLRLFM